MRKKLLCNRYPDRQSRARLLNGAISQVEGLKEGTSQPRVKVRRRIRPVVEAAERSKKCTDLNVPGHPHAVGELRLSWPAVRVSQAGSRLAIERQLTSVT